MSDAEHTMRRRRLALTAVLVAVGFAAMSCSAGDGRPSGDSYVRRLHAEAVAKGYDGQAALLADGHVSFSEFREADRAAIECAAKQGVALKATLFTDERGPSAMVEPVDTSSRVDANFVNGVIEKCQKTEQDLVSKAYVHDLPDLSDAAYALWVECAKKAGYSSKLPKSSRAINAKLSPQVQTSCDQWVTGELQKPQG